MNKPAFSFIVPTCRRIPGLTLLFESIKATTHQLDRVEVVLVVDHDDAESSAFSYAGVAVKYVPVNPGLTMGALCMAGYRATTGDFMMLLNDDVVLRTPGWDDQV